MNVKVAILLAYLQVVALLAIGWGMSALKTGNLRFFLIRPRPNDGTMSLWARVQFAALLICPGVAGIVLVLVGVFYHEGTANGVVEWLIAHTNLCAIFIGAELFGVFFLVFPELGVASARSAYPQLSRDDPWALMVARIVGAGALLSAIFFLISAAAR